MKITKRQLKRIIKEEKAKVLKEDAFRHPKTGENMWLMLNDIVDNLLTNGVDPEEIANELNGLATDVVASAGDSPYRRGLE